MTALLELKQRIKNLYSQYEIYILPVLRFVLAMVYFIWINTNMGYMKQIDNIFIVLILALICSILPSGVMIFVGFALMVAHGYALGIEVAGFMLVLILFMAILFLRFSSDNNLVLVFTPLSFGFSVPTLLPIGSGLLCNAFSALPAGCGVIIYYFIRFIRVQHKLLENPDVAIADKLKLLTDGIVQNWGMWITVIAFIAVILLVNLIRTRSFDYAWRIAIIAGGVVYVLMIIAGGFYFRLDIDVVTLIIYTAVIANGDIWKPEDAERILLHTGADMAMIGRGCFGNPWIFQQAKAVLEGQPVPPLPPLAERCETAVRQIRMAASYKGERVAVLEARKQYCWYLKGIPHANHYKAQIVQTNTLADAERITKGIQRDLRD